MSQAGWYQDPASPTTMRWWDGRGWTTTVRPGGFGGPDPAADRTQETNAGRWATRALWAGAAIYCIQDVVVATVYPSFWRAYRSWLNTSLGPNGTGAPLVLPHSFVVAEVLSPVISLSLIGAAVLFIMWFEKAATVARRAGVPARRSPGWAVGGWFIPIVSLWFPYQSAVDLFPPGHPGRSKVNRWWGLWLATQFATPVVMVTGFASSAAGWVGVVIAASLAISAATAGRAVIDEVDRVHAGLLGR